MGIFNRFSRVVKANLNSLVDSAEDPEKMLAQTVDDMRKGLKDVRRDLVETLGTAKRLETEAHEAEKDAASWDERAALAVRSGDDALAREALRQKLRATAKAEEVRARADRARAAADDMKDGLDRLEKKAEDLDAQKSALAAQVRTVRQQQTGPGRSVEFGTGALNDLERMTDRVDAMEAEIEASSVLEDTKKAELEARFRELEESSRSQVVEDELAELKRKADGG